MQKEIVIQKSLKNYLHSKSLSQSKLASISGVSASGLHGLLNGSIPKGLLTLISLSESLGVGLDELVFGEKTISQKINGPNLWEITGEYELIITKKSRSVSSS